MSELRIAVRLPVHLSYKFITNLQSGYIKPLKYNTVKFQKGLRKFKNRLDFGKNRPNWLISNLLKFISN